MRVSIGLKVFSIAVFLAVVMIIAALLSETRVKQAQVRIEVLAEHLLTLAEKSSDLRSIALRESIEFRDLISAEASGNDSEGKRIQKLYDDYFKDFTQIAKSMVIEIDASIKKLPTSDRKLIFTDIRIRLEALVTTHQQLHILLERIIARNAEGNEPAKAELISLFRLQDAAFIKADKALANEIRSVISDVALTAEKDEAAAIAFEHIVTAVAALFGLLLAGIMTRTLLSPIRNLRRA